MILYMYFMQVAFFILNRNMISVHWHRIYISVIHGFIKSIWFIEQFLEHIQNKIICEHCSVPYCLVLHRNPWQWTSVTTLSWRSSSSSVLDQSLLDWALWPSQERRKVVLTKSPWWWAPKEVSLSSYFQSVFHFIYSILHLFYTHTWLWFWLIFLIIT